MPLAINIVKSGNYHFEKKEEDYSFSEIRNRFVFYLTGGIPKSKYCCYIVQPSMLCNTLDKLVISSTMCS